MSALTAPGPLSPEKIALVLFNLGAPDAPEAVGPFLRNLFLDPAILRVPFFIRPFLGRFIARRREPAARENYALLGGRSPLLELTERQAQALTAALQARRAEATFRAFIAMRYWHPLTGEAAAALRAWKPDRIVLLPLYPQFSSTTTGSSLALWQREAARRGIAAPVHTLCCWPDAPGFIAASARLIAESWRKARATAGSAARLRLLFSAHGLPEKIIAAGDPYVAHVTRTAEALVAFLEAGPLAVEAPLEWRISYQSRATPEKWIEPSTEEEIARAAAEGVGLVVMPVAFVSEHSETLVELDVEYGKQARAAGLPVYERVPAQNDDPAFIDALAGLVEAALARGPGLASYTGERICPPDRTDCPCRAFPSGAMP
jgi:ferrochelatase